MALDSRLFAQSTQNLLAANQPVQNLLTGVSQGQQLAGEAQRQNLLAQQAERAEMLSPLQQRLMKQQLQSGQLGIDQAEAKLKAFEQAQAARAISSSMDIIKPLVDNGDIDGALGSLESLRKFGADDDDIAKFTKLLTTGDLNTVKSNVGRLDNTVKNYLGVKPASKFTDVEVDTDSGQVIYTNKNTGETITKPIGDFKSGDMTPKDRREFQKETRTSIRGDIGKVKKTAEEISSSRDKIDSLITQAQNGNRQAIAAVIMNLARLNSPGVVTDSDFSQMAGKQDPIAAAISIIQGKGIDVNAVMRGIDATNPDTFDAKSVIATADSLITSQLPTLNKSLVGLREKARIAELPTKQVNTLFAGTDFVGQIKGLAEPKNGKTSESIINIGRFRVEQK